MSAFKFNDNNAISVTCSVKYCPIGSVDDCKVNVQMFVVAKGTFA